MKKFEVGKSYKDIELHLYGMVEETTTITVIKRTAKTVWFTSDKRIFAGYENIEPGEIASRRIDTSDATTERFWIFNSSESEVFEAKKGA